jgi:5-methylcytosine-specific restriction endonuclease McrA
MSRRGGGLATTPYARPWRGISERLRAESPQCASCGARPGDTYIERGVTRKVRLSVDHIDRNTQHSERSNLRVLCVRCHSSLTGDGWRR